MLKTTTENRLLESPLDKFGFFSKRHCIPAIGETAHLIRILIKPRAITNRKLINSTEQNY